MDLFKNINKKCKIRYSPTEIMAAYDTYQLEEMVDEEMDSLFKCNYFRAQIKVFIKNNKGTKLDVEDVSMESLFIVKQNMMAQKYKGKDIHSYAIGIARNTWLNVLKKRKLLPENDDDLPEIKDSDNENKIIKEEEDKEKNEKLHEILIKCLSTKQIELLLLNDKKVNHEEIAIELDYKSRDAVSSAIYDAKKKLKNCIKNNTAYEKLLSSYHILKTKKIRK